MRDPESEWRRKGATLSDKSARKEFDLTQDEIVQAIQDGTIHYRESSMHGNPWLRLLRREVEALFRKKHSKDYLRNLEAKTELTCIDSDLRRLKAQIARLEQRKAELIAELNPASGK
jgi:hypothetical protein